MASPRRSPHLISGAVGVLLLGVVGTAAGAPAGAAPKGQEYALTVLGTSDTHGNVLNWDYFKDREYDDSAHNDVGLAKLATLVDDVRAEVGRRNTLVLDAGDTIQGTPLATYYAKQEPITETGDLHPVAAAMNVIDYDAATLGNHEFNYGIPLLDQWADTLGFPVLAANAVDTQTGKPAFTPFVIETMDLGRPHRKIDVGILGLTNPGVAIWDRANVEGKLRFDGMVETAQLWVPRMKAAGADIVIVSAHGGDSGISSYGPELPNENPVTTLAEQVPDVDAILFGHAHRDVPERFVTNEITGEEVLLSEPSRWGQRLTRMDFALTFARGDWRVTKKDATTINTNTVDEDTRVVDAVADQHATTVAYVNQVVAQSTAELSAAESYYKDTAILDFINEVQTDTVQAALAGTPYATLPVLSIAAPFSRTAVFPEGDVRIKDIAGLYIYDNTLEGVVMTGAEVKAYLEYSAKYFNRFAPGETVTPANVYDPAVPDYNYDTMSGVDYDIDISQPLGSRITRLQVDGVDVTPGQEFVVAVNNYRRSGGGNFPGIVKPQVYNAQQEIRQLLIDWASDRGVIDPAEFFVPSWKLVRGGEPVF